MKIFTVKIHFTEFVKKRDNILKFSTNWFELKNQNKY